MLYRSLITVISLVTLLTILTGCNGSTTSAKKAAPAALSETEKTSLTKQISLTFIDRYPNDQGLVRIYGQLTNGTKRQLISATVVAASQPVKGRAVTYGTVTVENVGPGFSGA